MMGGMLLRPRVLAAVVALTLSIAGCGGGGDGGGGDTKTLALGKSATVDFTSPASGDTPAVDTKLEVTVLAVRKGTQEELSAGGLKVEDKDKDATPYYVDARYGNQGTGKVKRQFSVGMEDSDGNSIPTTLIFGITDSKFDKCVDNRDGTVGPGESYESCTLFLVPKGATPEKVRFVSQDKSAKITFTDWEIK
jgi:hypothetical protein